MAYAPNTNPAKNLAKGNSWWDNFTLSNAVGLNGFNAQRGAFGLSPVENPQTIDQLFKSGFGQNAQGNAGYNMSGIPQAGAEGYNTSGRIGLPQTVQPTFNNQNQFAPVGNYQNTVQNMQQNMQSMFNDNQGQDYVAALNNQPASAPTGFTPQAQMQFGATDNLFSPMQAPQATRLDGTPLPDYGNAYGSSDIRNQPVQPAAVTPSGSGFQYDPSMFKEFSATELDTLQKGGQIDGGGIITDYSQGYEKGGFFEDASSMDIFNMFQGTAGLGLGLYQNNKNNGFMEDKIGIARDNLALKQKEANLTNQRRGY